MSLLGSREIQQEMIAMRYIENPTGNLLSYCGGGTQDGHGGFAAEHRAEMWSIANEAIQSAVPEMADEIYNESLSRLIGALRYDIETCVSISVDSMGEIFNGRQVKRLLSERIL